MGGCLDRQLSAGKNKLAASRPCRRVDSNVGHDLNLLNLSLLLDAIPYVTEASIGHKLTVDALKLGFGTSVRAYKNAIVTAAYQAVGLTT